MNYFRKSIHEMSGYVPGEQPPLGTKIIKLNSNENPYPPSPKALKVLQEIDGEICGAIQIQLAKVSALLLVKFWELLRIGLL
jgi:Histidinol-phosphate/aromatic aminotransferase and cobyric acid decarboxylase